MVEVQKVAEAQVEKAEVMILHRYILSTIYFPHAKHAYAISLTLHSGIVSLIYDLHRGEHCQNHYF